VDGSARGADHDCYRVLCRVLFDRYRPAKKVVGDQE